MLWGSWIFRSLWNRHFQKLESYREGFQTSPLETREKCPIKIVTLTHILEKNQMNELSELCYTGDKPRLSTIVPKVISFNFFIFSFGQKPALIRFICKNGDNTGAPNDHFLSNAFKRCFRLSGVLLKLCRLILGCAKKILSVRLF